MNTNLVSRQFYNEVKDLTLEQIAKEFEGRGVPEHFYIMYIQFKDQLLKYNPTFTLEEIYKVYINFYILQHYIFEYKNHNALMQLVEVELLKIQETANETNI